MLALWRDGDYASISTLKNDCTRLDDGRLDYLVGFKKFVTAIPEVKNSQSADEDEMSAAVRKKDNPNILWQGLEQGFRNRPSGCTREPVEMDPRAQETPATREPVEMDPRAQETPATPCRIAGNASVTNVAGLHQSVRVSSVRPNDRNLGT